MGKISKLIFIIAVFFSISASANTRILRITGDTNFGQLNFGQSITKTITIHNDGNSPLTINAIYPHEDIKAYYSYYDYNSCIGSSIDANGSCDINVTFNPVSNPPARNGIYSGMLYVASNKTAGRHHIYLKGSIHTRILRITGDTNFGQLNFGQSVTKTITIHNDGNSPLTINSVYPHEDIKAYYSYYDYNSCIGSSIDANGSCDINVTFNPVSNPPARNGMYSGMLYVASNKTEGRHHIYLKSSIVGNSNQAPIADAGEDQSVLMSGNSIVINLDGNQSTDPDSDPITYNWSITSEPSGSIATLNDFTAQNPTFTANIIGNYTLKLIVNDGQVDSVADTVVITVTDGNNNSPVPPAIDPTSLVPEFN